MAALTMSSPSSDQEVDSVKDSNRPILAPRTSALPPIPATRVVGFRLQSTTATDPLQTVEVSALIYILEQIVCCTIRREQRMSKLHHAIYLTIIGALLIAVVGLLTPKSTDDSFQGVGQGVVVFSFVPMDPESESVAAELTKTLIESLEKIANISVLTESDLPPSMQDSSNHHRWPKSELVSLILEGSVKESTEGTLVTVQLIDASSDAHVWSDTYVSEQVDVARIVVAVENQVVLTARH